jgi:hypothetical protein
VKPWPSSCCLSASSCCSSASTHDSRPRRTARCIAPQPLPQVLGGGVEVFAVEREGLGKPVQSGIANTTLQRECCGRPVEGPAAGHAGALCCLVEAQPQLHHPMRVCPAGQAPAQGALRPLRPTDLEAGAAHLRGSAPFPRSHLIMLGQLLSIAASSAVRPPLQAALMLAPRASSRSQASWASCPERAAAMWLRAGGRHTVVAEAEASTTGVSGEAGTAHAAAAPAPAMAAAQYCCKKADMALLALHPPVTVP